MGEDLVRVAIGRKRRLVESLYNSYWKGEAVIATLENYVPTLPDKHSKYGDFCLILFNLSFAFLQK